MKNEAPGKFKKVLLVEDDEIDIYIARKVIAMRQFADEIVLRTSVPDALSYINDLIPDPSRLPQLIFLDLNLPGADGFELLDALKVVCAQHKIDFSIVILTGVLYTYKNDVRRLKEYPMVRAILEKPLTPDKLSNIESYGFPISNDH